MKFGSMRNTFQLWWQINRRTGRRSWELLLLYIPRHAIRTLYASTASFLDRKLFLPINRKAIIRFHAQHLESMAGHYYIIVMPDVLHLLLPCLALLRGVRLIFVLNGAST